MASLYFVIEMTEDGLEISRRTKQAIEDWLNDTTIKEDCRPVPIGALPHGSDIWQRNEIVIIKGEIVVPARIEVVTKYEFGEP